MQLTLSIAIMQVPTSVEIVQALRFYCNFMLVVLSATVMFVDLPVAIMHVAVSVAIMQLEVSTAFMQMKVFAADMCDNFY